ncbi:GerAB/ArcD/ProY family transporter [Neobacillus pocheonensis]|uniref:GerAB/ArcD/ProY family transporter n=1 Tax=Neobacillus pocheonensis TaxID=363869 RepID=UPI003D277B04
MNQQPGKLGIREFVSIAILMVGMKPTIDLPIALYKMVQSAGWMIPIITAGIFFIPLFLLLKTMMLFQSQNLFSVIQKLLGKYIGFFLCLFIFVLSSMVLSIDTRIHANIIRTFYFTTTPTIFIYALLMLVCAYGAMKGILHVGSVAYLLVYYIVLFLIIALFLSFQAGNIQGMFPIWGLGKLEILKQSVFNLYIYLEFFLFTMLIPYVKSYKDFRKGTWFAYVYVCIQLSGAALVFICMFDTSLSGIGYPFHTAIRYLSLGSFLPNIEIIFFVIWVLGAFIRFTAFLYINSLMFGQIFKIKDFEYLIPSLAALYLLLGSIPETPFDVSLELKPMLAHAVGPSFTFISILLWLTAWLKGEFKHAKNKETV